MMSQVDYEAIVNDMYEVFLIGKYDGTKKDFKRFLEKKGLEKYYDK